MDYRRYRTGKRNQRSQGRPTRVSPAHNNDATPSCVPFRSSEQPATEKPEGEEGGEGKENEEEDIVPTLTLDEYKAMQEKVLDTPTLESPRCILVFVYFGMCLVLIY